MKELKWSEIKKRISALPPKEQLALFKDLHDLSPENREFLSTKLQTEEEVVANVNIYLDRVLAPFEVDGCLTKQGLAKSKKTIKEFQRACNDQEAVVELMLCFVEAGTEWAADSGDLFEEYYDTLDEVLLNLVAILKSPTGNRSYDDHRRERFIQLAKMASGIGWGYGDSVRDQVADLEDLSKKHR